MIKIQEKLSLLKLSEEAYLFYNNWINNIDFINKCSKEIRKLQSECTLLDLCINNPDKMEKIYESYIIDCYLFNDIYQYTIYIPELKLVSFIKFIDKFEIYQKFNVKLYLFNDEENIRRKIRLHIIL
jgi:hypothetical protein